MKKMTVVWAMVLLAGCAYGNENVTNMMTDPNFTEYEDSINELEHSYLDGKIKYSDYVEQKKQLEEDYTKEVRKREKIIQQTP